MRKLQSELAELRAISEANRLAAAAKREEARIERERMRGLIAEIRAQIDKERQGL